MPKPEILLFPLPAVRFFLPFLFPSVPCFSSVIRTRCPNVLVQVSVSFAGAFLLFFFLFQSVLICFLRRSVGFLLSCPDLACFPTPLFWPSSIQYAFPGTFGGKTVCLMGLPCSPPLFCNRYFPTIATVPAPATSFFAIFLCAPFNVPSMLLFWVPVS